MSMPMKYLLSIFLLLSINLLSAQPPQEFIDYMVKEVNDIRAKGCRCGGKRMKPANPVQWNNTLYKSARKHAKDMDRYNYFGHISKSGLDIGQRLDENGYNWKNAGENLGEGQKYFDEVLEDWLKSPSHCKMIMHPSMEEMAVAKYDKYWVQHFGTPMPDNHVRVNTYYSEGN